MIDYDIEGADWDRLITVEQDDGSTEKAYIQLYPLEAGSDEFLNRIQAKLDNQSTCDVCGEEVSETMGCPDGREICEPCYENGFDRS